MDNQTTEVLQHTISFYYEDYESLPDEDCDDDGLPESESEHIKESIIDGCNQGELNYYATNGEQFTGWWHIHPQGCATCKED